jgi:hypothetical protein
MKKCAFVRKPTNKKGAPMPWSRAAGRGNAKVDRTTIVKIQQNGAQWYLHLAILLCAYPVLGKAVWFRAPRFGFTMFERDSINASIRCGPTLGCIPDSAELRESSGTDGAKLSISEANHAQAHNGHRGIPRENAAEICRTVQ